MSANPTVVLFSARISGGCCKSSSRHSFSVVATLSTLVGESRSNMSFPLSEQRIAMKITEPLSWNRTGRFAPAQGTARSFPRAFAPKHASQLARASGIIFRFVEIVGEAETFEQIRVELTEDKGRLVKRSRKMQPHKVCRAAIE